MYRKLITIAVFSLCLAAPALAQRPARQGNTQRQQQEKQRQQQKQRKQKRPAGDIHKFQKALNLTDDQANQVRSLLAERDRQIGELACKRQKGQAKSIQEQFRTNLRGVLTPDQAAIFDQKFSGKKK